MTTKEALQFIQHWLYEHSNIYQASNFEREGYHECDIITVTNALIVTEVEIKISRSDFFADRNKKHKHRAYSLHKEYKHGFGKIPNKFYYACPVGLIGAKEIPDYAGLIWVYNDGKIDIVKKAPILHKFKASEKLLLKMLESQTAKLIFGCQYLTYKNRKAKQTWGEINEQREK